MLGNSCSVKALEIAERLSELEKEKEAREAELMAEPWLSLDC